ncbi:hypothetical protein KEM55_002324, partial [Ascosphaera atra]
GGRGAGPQDQGTDAVRVPEAQDPEAGEHGGAGVAAVALVVHLAEGVEEVLVVDTGLFGLVELVRENVQHELAVAVRVDVAVRLVVEEVLQLAGVDQVPVVR